MKINHLIFVLVQFYASFLSAQSPVAIDIKQFYAPTLGNYIEVYCQLDPGYFDLKTVKDSGHYAHLQQLMILRADQKIIDYRKKNIKSPYMSDTTLIPFTCVERFSVEPGNYILEYECTDLLNANPKSLKAEFKIEVINREHKTSFSHIELIENASSTIRSKEFAKSGYEIKPYMSAYYPEYIEKIAFYAEIYFESQSVTNEEKFVLTQYLTTTDQEQALENFSKMSKVSAKEVHPLLSSIDIKQLPTGNYYLILELKNRENKIISKEKIQFERYNPTAALSDVTINETTIEGTFVDQYNNIDSLNDFIACLKPIASNGENDMILIQLKNGNALSKKQFMYLFWKGRDNKNPEGAWLVYKQKVNLVNRMFGTRIKRGYDTERGRVYLKYGAPNQITDRPNEPSAYPYQIWQYYKADKYNNKFFLFYMPDLVSNDYELLNSDVPGEYRNPRWEAFLNKRNSMNPNVDFPTQDGSNQYGGNVRELLRNPR